jgi:hypothetical protein
LKRKFIQNFHIQYISVPLAVNGFILLQDEEFSDSIMNGQHCPSGRYAGPFRRRIFREHLGLLETADGESIVRDPVCSEFYHDRWQATANRNTEIFEEVSCLSFSSKILKKKSIEYV